MAQLAHCASEIPALGSGGSEAHRANAPLDSRIARLVRGNAPGAWAVLGTRGVIVNQKQVWGEVFVGVIVLVLVALHFAGKKGASAAHAGRFSTYVPYSG